jgi:predicted nucleic acid-binding protein
VAQIKHVTIQKVILDAGPIIHLEELNCLSLLSDFKELLVPEAVWKEVVNHKPSALSKDNVLFKKVHSPEKIHPHIFILSNAFNLDEGEMHAIVLCSLNKDAILLTDDAAARLAAKSLNIRAYGSIGILLRAIRRKQSSPAGVIKLLEEIPLKTTLFIRKNLLREIIEEVKGKYNL